MKRRDFVKGLAVASATATTALGQQKPQAQTPPPAANTVDQGTAAVQPTAAQTPAARANLQRQAQFHTPNIPISQPDAVALTDARYFTPTRFATLVHLCEVLMPAIGDYPSAVKAGTPEFLDFYIGGSPTADQQMYNAGLDRLEADTQKQFHVSFAKADAKQADAVIRPHLKGWMNSHPPKETHVAFINRAHRSIRTATKNSPAWALAADAAGERNPSVGLYVHPLDPGIETWVKHGVAQAASSSVQKHT